MNMVTLDAIDKAAERIAGVARRTPLMEVAPLTGEPPIWVKCENLQAAGAFKIRGAYNTVAQLDEAARGRGVITYSSGNHAQAVALAARTLGAQATVVMPTTAPRIKIDGARELGAEVLFEGTTSQERRVRAEAEAESRELTLVQPFDHEWIVAGQGTVGREILEQRPDLATVVVPIGGGGLVAGVSAAVKQTNPNVRVIGVEPVGAAKMTASLDAGRPVTLDRVASVADGLLPVRPGDLTFAHVQQFVDEVVTVEDRAIAEAVVWLHRRAKLVVEPSGAASVAAVRQLGAGVRRPVVAILSGGNMAPDTLAACVALAG
ncbi:MAG: threonine/serine dehydratase [Vicinamibacterales bacterium]|jgi:threonine dehydratase|nr:threonine ammonia-lyase [Acidobacteriota bacterium]MDP7472297.1 threonine/serine dehydratase [Vicinamibacterales bacterium]MDP7670644.1 threonine/serine dehydratase [Vicinamibacterales bacterium]HJO39073.1 threonine/serine dehydratase [Vicinamibacterales bacterium]|tara:strand:+ start:876 stop:1832 length:957 start_codon:yes stop_codon:yes gene_type:complete